MNDQTEHIGTSPTGARERREVICRFSDVIESMARSKLRIFSRELAEHGITILQYHALRSIATHGTELDMSSIATMTGLSASSITSIIDRLDQRGLVVRQHDAGDRRRVVATITDEGAALMQRIEEYELERVEHTLDGISDDELRACLDVFSRVDARIKELYDSEHRG